MKCVYKSEGILFKILPCLLIAMYAVMCLYGSTVHAASYTCEQFPKNTIITPEIYDNAKYHVIYVYWSGYWASARLFFSDEPIRVKVTYDERNGYSGISFTSTVTGQSIRYFEKYLDNGWDFSNETEFKNGGITTSLPSGLASCQDFPLEIKNYLADCNCDVYDEKTGEVVFQGAPLRQGIVTSETVEQIQPTVQETIVKILPIAIAVLALLIALRILPKVLLKFH